MHLMLLMVALTAIQVNPGDVVDVNVSSPALLAVNDTCMYFLENLRPAIHAEEGVYHLKVGVNCTPGLRSVMADGETFMQINVSKANCSYIASYAANVERGYVHLKRKVSELQNDLNDLNTKYREAIRQKEMTTIEIGALKSQVNRLKSEIEKLREELKKRETTVSDLEKELQSTVRQSEIYKIAIYFMLSLILGAFAALVYLSRKE